MTDPLPTPVEPLPDPGPPPLSLTSPATWVMIFSALAGIAAVIWPAHDLNPFVQGAAVLAAGIVGAGTYTGATAHHAELTHSRAIMVAHREQLDEERRSASTALTAMMQEPFTMGATTANTATHPLYVSIETVTPAPQPPTDPPTVPSDPPTGPAQPPAPPDPPVTAPAPVDPPAPPVDTPAPSVEPPVPVPPATTVAWVNATASLTAADFATIVEAMDVYTGIVTAAWPDIPTPIAHVTATATTIPDGAWPIYLLPTSDVANALGYHDVTDPQGRPYSRVFVDPIIQNGGQALLGPLTVASVCSHELAEMLVDPSATLWADMPDGRRLALEVGDPVESYSFNVTIPDGTLVSVSDFVKPSFFNSTGAGPYDHLGQITAPFALGDGGYEIVEDATGNVSQVFGEHPPDAWRLDSKRHPASRTARRLARAQAPGGIKVDDLPAV